MKNNQNLDALGSQSKLIWFDSAKIDAMIEAVKGFIKRKSHYIVVRRVMTQGVADFLSHEYCKKIDSYKDVIKRSYIKSNGAVYSILKCIGACVSDSLEHQDKVLRVGEALAVFDANIDAVLSGSERIIDYSQISETRRKEQTASENVSAKKTVDFAQALESGDANDIEKAIAESVKQKEFLDKTREEAQKNAETLDEVKTNFENTIAEEGTFAGVTPESNTPQYQATEPQQFTQNTQQQYVENIQPQQYVEPQVGGYNVNGQQNVQQQQYVEPQVGGYNVNGQQNVQTQQYVENTQPQQQYVEPQYNQPQVQPQVEPVQSQQYVEPQYNQPQVQPQVEQSQQSAEPQVEQQNVQSQMEPVQSQQYVEPQYNQPQVEQQYVQPQMESVQPQQQYVEPQVVQQPQQYVENTQPQQQYVEPQVVQPQQQYVEPQYNQPQVQPQVEQSQQSAEPQVEQQNVQSQMEPVQSQQQYAEPQYNQPQVEPVQPQQYAENTQPQQYVENAQPQQNVQPQQYVEQQPNAQSQVVQPQTGYQNPANPMGQN